MSAISVILLATAGTAVGLGVAALHTARGLRADIAALRAELTGPSRATVPPARHAPEQAIHSAVAEALAAERERELAEARAYWAEQEAREAREASEAGTAPGRARGPLPGGSGLGRGGVTPADEELLDALLERYLLSDSGYATPLRDGVVFVPRQPGLEGLEGLEGLDEPQPDAESAADAATAALRELDGPDDAEHGESADHDEAYEVDEEYEGDADEDEHEDEEPGAGRGERPDAAELAAARRRHPSHPGYTLTGEPVDRSHQRTAARLSQLAEARTPLTEVRPGPLGTLDVLLFADGTTLCLSPSHRQAAERLAAAVRDGHEPVLMGGSGIAGAYALTFSCGEESVYLLVDRVVATSTRRR
ncbi:hypothetical protein ACTWP5_23925 [Streptomyces sp. 4N509B]|uniref:hypothetical protein n=1 Tax=Streptomyces sp. 4N509B TaxID=3457413 RepID=UPI003FD1B0B1